MKLTEQEYKKLEEFVNMAFDFARNDDSHSLKIMLENGLNPTRANHKGDTLLMLASYHNALSVVDLLLEYGAEVDKVNDKGHTPLAGVCFKGYVEVAKKLLEQGANPHGDSILSPITPAIMIRRKDILKLLLAYNTKLSVWQKLGKSIICRS